MPFGIAPPGYRLPPGTRVGAVTLQVADLARSEAFYRTVLGLVRRDGADGRTALGAPGGTESLVELVERPGARPPAPGSRLGLYHFALLVPDRAALGRFARHARTLSLRLGMADHLVSEALYLTDPDGLGIEVYADRPRETWRSDAGQLVMATDPLDIDALLAQAGQAPFDGLPAGTVVGHVHLHVGDIAEAARFYHDGLGLDKVVWDYPGALFLSAGGYHHHLGTNVWAENAPPAAADDARLLSWTLVLPDAREVERAAQSLQAAGYRVAEPGAHGGRLAEDPWGTPVELVARREAWGE